MDMKKKKAISDGSTGTIVGLFLLVTAAVAVPSASASDNCVDIDCLKEKVRLKCELKTDESEYINCKNMLKCMDADEQELRKECINEYRACDSTDLLLRSWCEYD
jgi:hypothetical protein